MKKMLGVLICCMMFFACATQQHTEVVSAEPCCGVTVACDDGEKVVILEHIMFDWDKDNIRSDQQPVIDRITKTMSDNPKIKVLLDGYASVEGETDYNLDLSTRRVNTVKNALVAKGVSSDRIVDAQGKGETDIFGLDLPLNRKVKVTSK